MSETDKYGGDERHPHGDDPLWRFSLDTYARPGVASACLALQDRRGLDVNLLLYLCWRGSLGLTVEPSALGETMARAALWQSLVVRPLREVRRALKGQEIVERESGESLRQRVKQLELEAERLEQAMLRDSLPVATQPPLEDEGEAARRAARNVAVYLSAANIEPSLQDIADLAAILRGSFPRVPPLQAVWMLWP